MNVTLSMLRTIFFFPSAIKLFTFSRRALLSSPRTIRPSSATTDTPFTSQYVIFKATLFFLHNGKGKNNVALKMTYREVNGVSVVALDGRIVLGEESNALREKVKSLIAEGKKKIVLNMDNVTFIDSAGLGTLVAAHHSVKTQGASLRLCHLGSKFQEVLQITKLLTVFDVYNTEAEAVASFSK